MLKALADDVTERMRLEINLRARHEGVAQDGWILLDCGDTIVHLFSPDQRNYYRLEDLWSTGKVLLRLK